MSAVGRALSGAWFLARGAVTSVVGNISLALLALAAAVSLWLYVTDKENPRETQTFNNAVPVEFVNVPTGLAIANTSVSSVRIRVEAPRNEIDDLTVDDFEATVDMGGLANGATSVEVSVTSSRRRTDVVSVTPGRVDVMLESLRVKEVPVTVSLIGLPRSGFAATGERAQPDRVSVSGPESLVALVDAAVAEVGLTGRVSVASDRIELEPRDEQGGAISRVTVNPGTATVSVDIEQVEFSLPFVVAPAVSGAPSAGYNLVGVTTSPRLVTVTGPIDVLQSIDAVRGIATEEISIADARDDVRRTVSLSLPAGARVEGSESIEVVATIDAARGEFTFSVAPQIRNVATGLAATPAVGAVTVTLSGEVPVLQALTAASITAIIDAQGLEAGLHTLPVAVEAPEGTLLVRVEPVDVGIALTQRQ